MHESSTELISRRRFLSTSAALVALRPPTCSRAQQSTNSSNASTRTTIEATPSRQFKNAYLIDVSPNSKMLSLYFTSHPEETFALQGRWKQQKEPINQGSEHLEIVEIGTWKTVYTTPLEQKPRNGSFFGDDNAFYIETLPFPDNRRLITQQVVVDLITLHREEHLRVDEPGRT